MKQISDESSENAQVYCIYRHAHALMYNKFEGLHERICVFVCTQSYIEIEV